MLGNLRLKFAGGDAGARNYRRELNLSDAVARVIYEQQGRGYQRELFVSAPDQAVVMRLTADRPGVLSFDAALERPERATVVADGSNGLLMSGQLGDGKGGGGMKFAARLRVINRGGQASVEGQSVRVRDADEATLVVTAATDYMGFAGRRTADALAASSDDMRKATAKTYRKLMAAHVADFKSYFDRVGLTLGPPNTEAATTMTTPARLKAFSDGARDPGLAALYFQFGRYLLISSSRPGGMPANLQGIWAEELQAPWNADWHLNINVQMNYWPAEVANLSELHQPLFALIASLQEPGARTARAYYDARGWVAHVLANPWGFTSPGEGASWGSSVSGSAWLCQHLWDHYLFTRDREFLKWAYPVMKGSALFYTDMLIEEPRNKWLVTAPSNSPENAFKTADGQTATSAWGRPSTSSWCATSSTPPSKPRACSAWTRSFAESFRRSARGSRRRASARDGRVMEWLEEYEEPEPTHRHVSHLWALYPAAEITPDGDARARRRRAQDARTARRHLDGLVARAQDQLLGAARRRRPRAPPARAAADAGRQQAERRGRALLRRQLREFVRLAPALPDRRQLRRRRGRRRDALAEPQRRRAPAARAARRVARRRGQGPARARRLRRGHRVEGREARRAPRSLPSSAGRARFVTATRRCD